MKLPLFPLSTVLFPGMPLPLFIFEERYKEMVARCLSEKIPFVVALIREGTEALGPPAEPFRVGCSAAIRSVAPAGDGRMHIKTVGQQRLRIEDIYTDESYLTCRTESYEISGPDAATGEREAEILRDLIGRYVAILAPGQNRPLPNLSLLETNKLMWLAADLLQIRKVRKQALLESADRRALFDNLKRTFEEEIALLSAIANQKKANTDGGPISLN